MQTPVLIPMREVVRRTSLSKTDIHHKRARGHFPQAVVLGVKRIAFVEQEVNDWIMRRVNARERQFGTPAE